MRLDTCITPQTITIAKSATVRNVLRFKYNRNILTIVLPSNEGITAIPVRIFTMSGTVIKTVTIPLTGNNAVVLDIKKENLPAGNYTFKSKVKEYQIMGRVCYIR